MSIRWPCASRCANERLTAEPTGGGRQAGRARERERERERTGEEEDWRERTRAQLERRETRRDAPIDVVRFELEPVLQLARCIAGDVRSGEVFEHSAFGLVEHVPIEDLHGAAMQILTSSNIPCKARERECEVCGVRRGRLGSSGGKERSLAKKRKDSKEQKR